MAKLIPMPKWGMTMQEGTIGAWLKAEGDEVAEGEEIVEIESDKAIQLVEAPVSGVLARILVEAGETVPITTPIAVIADPGEEIPDELLEPTEISAETTSRQTEQPQNQTPNASSQRRARKPGGRVPASPAAKRLAAEHQIDLATLIPTGPDGMVRVEDVEAAIKAGDQAAGPVSTVTFYCRSQAVEGRLYLPESLFKADPPQAPPSPLPGLVLCLGYTYTQDLLVGDMARQLAEEGRACLVFDYRGFGRSGEAVNVVSPFDQIEDIRAAAAYLGSRSEVDETRLSLLGISLGAGHAITAAACDPTVSAVVAISAVADGRQLLSESRDDTALVAFDEEVAADRIRRSRGQATTDVDAWDIVLPDEQSRTFLDALYAEFPDLSCRLSLETADLLGAYRPQAYASEIRNTPVLLVHGEQDGLVPTSHSQALADAIGDSADRVVIPDMTHFNWARPGADLYAVVMDQLSGWLTRLGR